MQDVMQIYLALKIPFKKVENSSRNPNQKFLKIYFKKLKK